MFRGETSKIRIIALFYLRILKFPLFNEFSFILTLLTVIILN